MSVTPQELANTLRRRQQVVQRHWEERSHALRYVLAEEFQSLLRAKTITRAWLIGSLAWGTFGVHSDVDLVVEGLDPRHAARLWSDLCHLLNVQIDLLRLEELDGNFQQRVLAEGVAFHVT